MKILIYISMILLILFVLVNFVYDIKSYVNMTIREGATGDSAQTDTTGYVKYQRRYSGGGRSSADAVPFSIDQILMSSDQGTGQPKEGDDSNIVSTDYGIRTVTDKFDCEMELEKKQKSDPSWNVFAYNVAAGTVNNCVLYKMNDVSNLDELNTVGKANWKTYLHPGEVSIQLKGLKDADSDVCKGCVKPHCVSANCKNIFERNGVQYKECPMVCKDGETRRSDVNIFEAGGCRNDDECKDCGTIGIAGNKGDDNKWSWENIKCSLFGGNSNDDTETDETGAGETPTSSLDAGTYPRGDFCNTFCEPQNNGADSKDKCDIVGGAWNQDTKMCTVNRGCSTNPQCKAKNCPCAGGPPLTGSDFASYNDMGNNIDDGSEHNDNDYSGMDDGNQENRLGGSSHLFNKHNKLQNKFYYDSVWRLFN